MATKLRSILQNDVWKLVDRPNDKKVVGSRIILTDKYQSNGLLKRKARIVARGFCQRPGLDFNETFAPVARMSSDRLLIAIAAHYKLHVHQCDVKTVYLNSSIKEEIYMETPEQLDKILEKLISIEDYKSDIRIKATKILRKLKSGDKVCRLQKALYRLKQSSREWNTRIY